MTIPATYNPPPAYEGNTSDPLVFNFTFDLSDYSISFTLAKDGKAAVSLSVGDGITVDGTEATIGPYVVPAGDGRGATTYDYQLTLTSGAGVVTTYVAGKVRVLGDVTW